MDLSKEVLERLIARSTDIVVATDRKGNVAYYNDGASKILGYSSEEILGVYVERLYLDLDEAKRVMRAMRGPEHGGKGIVASFQTTFLSKKGEKIPVAISGTLLYDDRGEEDGTIGFAKDLREILRKDQLATLGEVAVGLSHEINNPLAVILNQTELLEGEIERLAGDADTSVECERIEAIRRLLMGGTVGARVVLQTIGVRKDGDARSRACFRLRSLLALAHRIQPFDACLHEGDSQRGAPHGCLGLFDP